MKEVLRVYYIGEKFYYDSGTAMSPIYLENGSRADWGLIRAALIRGKEVHIRQATDAEMLAAYKQLEKFRK